MMNLPDVFAKEYKAFHSCKSELDNAQIIKCIYDDSILLQGVHINLCNQHLNEILFIPISKSLCKIGPSIIRLDLSFNLAFNDCCSIHLERVLRYCSKLELLTLEKTGISDQGGVCILKALGNIKNLNMSSNKLSEKFMDRMGAEFKAGRLQNLQILNLSNLKMNEKGAISLFEPLIQSSKVETLNVSMNCLKFKTGSFLINLLREYKESPLIQLNLEYNSMSKALLKEIDEELNKKRLGSEEIYKIAENDAIEEESQEVPIKDIYQMTYNHSMQEYKESSIIKESEEEKMSIEESPKEIMQKDNEEEFEIQDQLVLNEEHHNSNYENLKNRILQNKTNAKQFHPFYCNWNKNSKENLPLEIISQPKKIQAKKNPDLLKKQLYEVPGVIAEELEEGTLTKDPKIPQIISNNSSKEISFLYSSNIKDEKTIIKYNIGKLLAVYNELTIGDKKCPLEVATEAIKETYVVKNTNVSYNNYIPKNNTNRSFFQYTTNESKNSLDSRRTNIERRKPIVYGSEEQKVYKEIIERSNKLPKLKRFSLNN